VYVPLVLVAVEAHGCFGPLPSKDTSWPFSTDIQRGAIINIKSWRPLVELTWATYRLFFKGAGRKAMADPSIGTSN